MFKLWLFFHCAIICSPQYHTFKICQSFKVEHECNQEGSFHRKCPITMGVVSDDQFIDGFIATITTWVKKKIISKPEISSISKPSLQSPSPPLSAFFFFFLVAQVALHFREWRDGKHNKPLENWIKHSLFRTSNKSGGKFLAIQNQRDENITRAQKFKLNAAPRKY